MKFCTCNLGWRKTQNVRKPSSCWNKFPSQNSQFVWMSQEDLLSIMMKSDMITRHNSLMLRVCKFVWYHLSKNVPYFQSILFFQDLWTKKLKIVKLMELTTSVVHSLLIPTDNEWGNWCLSFIFCKTCHLCPFAS